MFFGSRKVIGLDIGTSTIKLAELDVNNSGAELVSFGFAPTPVGSVNGGEISDGPALSIAVAGIVNELKSKRKKICLGMWGTSVIVKKITIPRIEKKLIAEQLRWEAEQYIPFDINQISLSHHVIENNLTPDTLDILLVAAQNEMVAQYTAVVTDAKLQISVLDVSGFALANVFEANYGRLQGQTVALLNIGAGNTNFVVLHNGEVVFSRDIPVGGSNYTSEIQKEMGVSPAEAESLKLSAATKNEVPEQIQNIINTSNEAMTDEIRNGFDFFAASTSGLTISRCYYSGGGSAMPGLVQKISEMANINLDPINPFLKIKMGKRLNRNYLSQVSSFAPIAVGLGLRKVGDS
jgi:type IV pilus assembly protein PilM